MGARNLDGSSEKNHCMAVGAWTDEDIRKDVINQLSRGARVDAY